MRWTHTHNSPPQHWEPGSMCVSAVWVRYLQTQRSLAQLLPCAACAESSNLAWDCSKCGRYKWDFLCWGVFMWARNNFFSDLNRGFFVFAMCVMCFRVVRQFGYVCLCTCSIPMFTSVQHPWHLYTFGASCPSFLVVPHCRTAHPSVCCSRINNFPHIVCHPTPPILTQPYSRSMPSALVAPFAQEIPPKKWRFDWTNVSSNPTYGTLETTFMRRARAGLLSHNSSLGVRHAIVGGTNCTKAKPHVAHVVDCAALPLQFDGHTMEAQIGGFPLTMSADVKSGCLELPW